MITFFTWRTAGIKSQQQLERHCTILKCDSTIWYYLKWKTCIILLQSKILLHNAGFWYLRGCKSTQSTQTLLQKEHLLTHTPTATPPQQNSSKPQWHSPPAGQSVLPHHRNYFETIQGIWQRALSLYLSSKCTRVNEHPQEYQVPGVFC